MIYSTTRFLGETRVRTTEIMHDGTTKVTSEYRLGNKIEKREIVYLENGVPVLKEEYKFWANNSPMMLDYFVLCSRHWVKAHTEWFCLE